MERLGVGVIGTGLMGEVHARNLAGRVPGAELVAVADADRARAHILAGQVGGIVYGDGMELIADAAVHAVVVASPDATHAAYTQACIAAGKPVLCEKPLASNADDAKAVVDAEAAAGRRLVQLGFMREFDDGHVAVRAAVQWGQIGIPVLFRGTHVNPTSFGATVERAITQSMIHDLHSARFLTGDEFVQVFTTFVPLAGCPLAEDPAQQVAQMVVVSARLSSGALAVIDVTLESGYGYEVMAEVVGTSGRSATGSPVSSTVVADGQARVPVTPSWAARFAPAYLTEITAWVGSLHDGRPVGPGAHDGYVANLVAEACVRSARSGRPERVG